MSAESADPSDSERAAAESPDDGPGCMPAILAASALLGILGFLVCGVMTWLIFQKQDELALRSMRGSFIPAVEQSLLEPAEKAKTVRLLSGFADGLERGQYEGWQASGVMQRMTRLPILQWGQARNVESFVNAHPDAFNPDDAIQFLRLRKGVEQNTITTFDFVQVLEPVVIDDAQRQEARLVDPLTIEAVQQVVKHAYAVADRSGVDPAPKNDVSIDTLVRRQIEAGLAEGGY